MKMLSSDETLFRNDEVFDFSHIPDQFNYRDSQLKDLAYCLKPATRGAKPLNAFLVGPPATGKTTALKLTFGQLQDYSDKAVLVYVNCQIHSSPFRIFSEIHKKIFGFLPAETGIPLSSLYDKIFPKLGKRVLAVALDEISCLQDSEKVLYDLLRAHESYPNVKIGVITISQKNNMHKISDRVRSVFHPHISSFTPYSKSEINAILKHRVEIGLYDGVLSDKLLEKISGITSEKKDLRYGIALLKQAVMQAEASSSRAVREEHLKKAVASVNPGQDMKDDERNMLELLDKSITSGELYKLFNRKTGASYSSFYRTLQSMESSGLIKTVEKSTEKGGKTRTISKL